MSAWLRSRAMDDLHSLVNVEKVYSLKVPSPPSSSMPIVATHSFTHSQRSKNGKSPGWRSCWVGMGRDGRYARSNGGFGQCAYYTRIAVYV